MQYRDAIRYAMKTERITARALSRAMGKSDGYITAALQHDMSAARFFEIAQALGYEVCILKKDTGIRID